jgi:hypothetical protein
MACLFRWRTSRNLWERNWCHLLRKLYRQAMSERYALIWAIAILRDDYQYTWLTISKKMGYSMTKVIHLYNQAKPHYNLEQPK